MSSFWILHIFIILNGGLRQRIVTNWLAALETFEIDRSAANLFDIKNEIDVKKDIKTEIDKKCLSSSLVS